MKQTANIVFSVVAAENVAHLMDVVPIMEALKSGLDLASFGAGVKSIDFTVIAVPESNTLHQNEAHYDKASKTVTIAAKLSYAHVRAASVERVQEMIGGLFFVSLDFYQAFNIPDFNLAAFRFAVGEVLDRQGWLLPQHEYHS